MTVCPNCGTRNPTLIVNVATGMRYCTACARTMCPSFMPHYILTGEDVAFMRACGIDPEVSRIEDAHSISHAVTNRHKAVQ